MRPLALGDATADTRWIDDRALVMHLALAPDPTGRTSYRVHVVVQALDGSARRLLTPHNVTWAQVSPDGASLASISFDDQRLVITEIATGAERTVVADVMPARSPTLRCDLPPTLQWRPDGGAILVQSPERDADGDGELDHATMRLWDTADGALLGEFERSQMGPFLFLRDGQRVAVPSFERDDAMIAIDPRTAAETSLPLDGGALHLNQTPSLVLHDAGFAPDGTALRTRGGQLVIGEQIVLDGSPPLFAPAATADGRHVVFTAEGELYVYARASHRLGRLGPGGSPPLPLRADYRPPAARLARPFDLAYRTF